MATNVEIVLHGVGMTASSLFAVIPFISESRVRADWAKVLFIVVGVIGVLVGGESLLLILHWIALSRKTVAMIEHARILLCGVALGCALALILSRQLMGSKAVANPEFRPSVGAQ